jgi:hypothetical protein
VFVRLKPPPVVAPQESDAPEIPLARWQELEARWNAILGVEAAIDALRLRMEGLRGEMEALAKARLTTEEKVHALSADVVQWQKAKSRAHYALPKAAEFIHRATWARGTPERKALGELFEDATGPPSPFPEMEEVSKQLEALLQGRQALSAQGIGVYQECQSVSAGIQGTLRTLQSNAAANANRKKRAARAKRKFG